MTRIASIGAFAASSAAEMMAAVPRHLSLACRYHDSHDACDGLVRLGGPDGVVVACHCGVCEHVFDLAGAGFPR